MVEPVRGDDSHSEDGRPSDLGLALARAGDSIWHRLGILVAVAVTAALLIAGCSQAAESPAAAGDATRTAPRPADTTPCEDGNERGCSITLGRQGSVLSCYHGVQVCLNGVWQDCGSGEVQQEMRRESTLDVGAKSQALSTTTKCTDNPCDPFCQGFDEAPPTPIVAISGPTGINWQTGSLSTFPGGLVKKGLTQPCDEGLDCQFNMHCDNPTYGSCNHSVCQSGAALESGCSDCATRICEADASCCAAPPSTASSCSHDPCVTGTRLKDECDPCVTKICASNPSCCATGPSGGWTQSCVDKVVSVCGNSCACGADEKGYAGKCYYHEETNAKWTTAKSNCEGRGTSWSLVTLNDATENAFVATLDDDSARWIGFTDLNAYSSESNWVWASGTGGTWKDTTKTGTSYTNFISGQPTSTPDCARMRNNASGTWEGYDCSSSHDYICEGPASIMVAAPSTATWSASCVAKVRTVCDAECSATDPTASSGACVPWYPEQTDPNCAGVDLSLGVPCGHSIPVCNHGLAEAPAGIQVVTYPANSGHFPQCAAAATEANAVNCITSEPIPAGKCIELPDTSCKDKNGNVQQLSGNREIMVNPTGAVTECSCQDNWTLSNGNSTCSAPACAGGNTAATSVKKPVDVIIAIDNSGSMAGEIAAVQTRISTDLAQILADSGVDYRVIMVSRFGDVNTAVGDSDHPICIGAPLGANACTDAAHETLVHNPPHFYHYSANIGSLDAWCKLLYGFNHADEINEQRSGWVDKAPSGWCAFLRANALKAFLVVTDDDVDCNSYGYDFDDANTSAAGTTAASQFDTALLSLSPTQFGTAAKRNYVWHSIIGMVENSAGATVPWDSSAAIQTGECSPTSQSEGPGTGYQALSRITGGLRYPICQNSTFNAVFQAIAKDIVETASAGCGFSLPSSASFNPSLASVSYTNAADVRTNLTQVADAAACTATGWYFDDPAQPTTLNLCPTSCDTVQADTGAQVWVELGCPGELVPTVHTEQYTATCSKGSYPQWGYLSYDATVPANTSVIFRGRVAKTTTDLASASWQALSVATPAAPDCDPAGPSPCPLSLFAAFGAEVALPALELELTATPNGSVTPSINDWRLTYSCPPSE